MTKQTAIEITTFKLKGFSCKQFIDANSEIDAFLKQQSGFVSRTIIEQSNGIIADILLWDSVKNGTESMRKLMHELRDSPVHDMIDQASVSWDISKVQHYFG